MKAPLTSKTVFGGYSQTFLTLPIVFTNNLTIVKVNIYSFSHQALKRLSNYLSNGQHIKISLVYNPWEEIVLGNST